MGIQVFENEGLMQSESYKVFKSLKKKTKQCIITKNNRINLDFC